jgi:phosphate butyryltransferase
MFRKIDDLKELALQKGRKRLTIAVAEDNNILGAVMVAKNLGVIAPIFIGDKEIIKRISLEEDFIIGESEIVNEPDHEKACMLAAQIVSEGKADILMKGLIQTGTFLKSILHKEFNLLTGNLLSHFAIFESPYYHKLFALSDAAMNIAPTLDEKTSITKNAIEIMRFLGVEVPKVAIITAVETVNPKMLATVDAHELKLKAENGEFGSCFVDGPLALDNAISIEAAKHKGINSLVAGDADILIAPDIQSGNILYKSLNFLGNARCAAIIAGAKIPVVLTSRADSEESKFLSILLGVLCSR